MRDLKGGPVYRMILCIGTAMLVATAIQPATADDPSECTYGPPDEAIAACSRLLVLNLQVAFVYNNRGNAYFRKGDYDQAILDYDQAIRLDPKNARFYNNRGEAYTRNGDYDRAIADFDRALKLAPAEHDARPGETK